LLQRIDQLFEKTPLKLDLLGEREDRRPQGVQVGATQGLGFCLQGLVASGPRVGILQHLYHDIGQRLRSRLMEMCLVVNVLGTDHRQARQAGHLVATDHPDKDPRFDPEVDTPADASIRPLICVPLQMRGKILGVMRAFPSGEVPASARTAEVLAAAMSAAVRNVLLYRSLLESIDEVARVRRGSRSRP
jgi:GAF domain-containing protein